MRFACTDREETSTRCRTEASDIMERAGAIIEVSLDNMGRDARNRGCATAMNVDSYYIICATKRAHHSGCTRLAD